MRSLLHPNINKYNFDNYHFKYSYKVEKQEDFSKLTDREVSQWKRCGIIFLKQFNDKKYILVVKGTFSGIWSLPKGRIMKNENEEECACREVYEETGIKINPEFLKSLGKLRIDHNVYFILDLDNFLDNKDFNNFNNFTIYDTQEVCDVAWKNITELSLMKCNKDIRNLLKKSEKYSNKNLS